MKVLFLDFVSFGLCIVGKINIGCIFIGVKDGVEKIIYIYNVCDY